VSPCSSSSVSQPKFVMSPNERSARGKCGFMLSEQLVLMALTERRSRSDIIPALVDGSGLWRDASVDRPELCEAAALLVEKDSAILQHCNPLQHTATHSAKRAAACRGSSSSSRTMHYNTTTLQHPAILCNTKQPARPTHNALLHLALERSVRGLECTVNLEHSNALSTQCT